MKITVLVVDDHLLFRQTCATMLNNNPGIQVIAECGTCEEAVEVAKNQKPDIVLMDIHMRPVSGFEITEKILVASPSSRIIGLSMHPQSSYAKKLLQLGGSGYVTKNSSIGEMVNAIFEVQKGGKYLCEEIKNNLTELMLGEESVTPTLNSLTIREAEIVNLIKEGYPSKQIAHVLNICLKTVEVHRHNVLKKLKLRNTASLVNFVNQNTVGY